MRTAGQKHPGVRLDSGVLFAERLPRGAVPFGALFLWMPQSRANPGLCARFAHLGGRLASSLCPPWTAANSKSDLSDGALALNSPRQGTLPLCSCSNNNRKQHYRSL